MPKVIANCLLKGKSSGLVVTWNGQYPLLKHYHREEMSRVEYEIQQLETESQTEAYSLREIAKTADELIAEANELKKQRGRLKDEMVSDICNVIHNQPY